MSALTVLHFWPLASVAVTPRIVSEVAPVLSEALSNVPAGTPSILQMSCPVPDVVHWNTADPPGHMVPAGDVS